MMMNKLLALPAVLSLLPVNAFGDFVPGRVRNSAGASMRVVQGTGRFAKVEKAQVLQFLTDGVGVSGYSLSFDEQEAPLRLAVVSTEASACGRNFVARSAGEKPIQLRLAEVESGLCRTGSGAPVVWQARLQVGADTLSLEGDADYGYLTE